MSNDNEHLTRQQLQQYQSGLVDDVKQRQIEQHLDSCAECLHALSSIIVTDDRLLNLLQSAGAAGLNSDRVEPIPRDDAYSKTAEIKTQTTTLGCSSAESLRSDEGEKKDLTNLARSPKEATRKEPQAPVELTEHSRYRLERWLGSGGMGDVWLARQTTMNRLVALKVIRSELLHETDVLERFRREIHALARLDHPNIATAYDAEKVGDVVFLVVQYIEGENLLKILRRGPLPVEEACAAIIDAARALAHAHELGLVHRDVKPGNMIRDAQGIVRIIDFGLVAAVEDDACLTNPAWVLGTIDYLAPEQADDGRCSDARSDLYSLGCSLYHLLAGQPPFAGASPLKKLEMHRTRAPQPIAGVPSALWKIVSRLMAKRPQDRFQSATQVLEALEQFCQAHASGRLAQSKRMTVNAWIGLGLATMAILAMLLVAPVSRLITESPKSDGQEKSTVDPQRSSVDPQETGGKMFAGARTKLLLTPTSLGDGSREDYQVADHRLRLDGMTRSHQVWLNFAEERSDTWVLKARIRILQTAPRAFVKLVLLSDSVNELNLLLSRTEGKYWIALERPLSGGGNSTLASQQLPDNFGTDFESVEFRLKAQQLSATINGRWSLQAPHIGGTQFYPALAVSGCIVEFEEPQGVIP